MRNVEINLIKKDMGIIRYLIIKSIWDDLAWFNRNGIGKKPKSGITNWSSQYYSLDYKKELLSDLESDWFKNLCGKWGLNHKDTRLEFMRNKKWISGRIEKTIIHQDNERRYLKKRHMENDNPYAYI